MGTHIKDIASIVHRKDKTLKKYCVYKMRLFLLACLTGLGLSSDSFQPMCGCFLEPPPGFNLSSPIKQILLPAVSNRRTSESLREPSFNKASIQLSKPQRQRRH